MTRRKKLVYLLGLTGIFIIVVPLLVLFSSGYRLDGRFRLVKTGGIYLANKEPDIIVRLNKKNVKKAGMFEKNILIDDLTPKTYYVTVEKNGYKTWKKNIKVEEQKVEVCYPLLIPVKLNPQPVPKYLSSAENKDKKQRKANEEYSEAMKLFTGSDKRSGKGIIPASKDNEAKKYGLDANRKLYKKVLLFRQKNRIYVKWTGADQKRPFFIDTSDEKPVLFPSKKILSFAFFPGRHDSMLVLLENRSLYAVEIDTRFDIHNIYQLVSNCSKFAVKDEFLYYLSGHGLYKIDLEPQ
jgi:hypothetical protein